MNPKQLIIEEIIKFNNTNSNYGIDILDEECIQRSTHNIDFRLNNKKNIESSVVFTFVDKEKRTELVTVTLLIFNKMDFNQIYFWKLKDNHLKKVSLNDIKNEIGDYACTLGYAQSTPYFKQKYQVTKFYIDLIQKLIDKTNIFIYLEPTGKELLQDYLVNYEKIDYCNNYFEHKNIGEVRDVSKAAQKLANVLNFKKVNSLYNIYTLGPVYFNKDIKI